MPHACKLLGCRVLLWADKLIMAGSVTPPPSSAFPSLSLRPSPLQSAGGILLPETGKKLNEGKVIAVGAGALNRDGKVIPMNLKAGDTVLLPEYGGHTVKIGEEELHIYREEDILGRFQ